VATNNGLGDDDCIFNNNLYLSHLPNRDLRTRNKRVEKINLRENSLGKLPKNLYQDGGQIWLPLYFAKTSNVS
jgi:hypothetical protein